MPQSDNSSSVADKWAALPPTRRKSIMQTVIQQARDVAATSIMLQSQGGPNDIVKAATEAKLAQTPTMPPQAVP
jgi:hypothetical protein